MKTQEVKNGEVREVKTRAEYAVEALKAAMQPDRDSNFGLNEAYRMGLEDMQRWIDLGDEPPFTGLCEKNKD